MARPRLLSLPSQITATSPRIDSNKIKMNPHFVWSARKIFSKDKNFERVLQQTQLNTPRNESPNIIMNTPNNNISKLAAKNGILSAAVEKNQSLFLIGKCLFKSPVAIRRQTSADNEMDVSNEGSYSNMLLAKTPEKQLSPEIMSPAVESLNDSICILEEIINVDSGTDLSDEEQAEKADESTENSVLDHKKNLQLAEYRQYLRLKMKYEGRMKNRKNRTESRLRRAIKNGNLKDDDSDKDLFL